MTVFSGPQSFFSVSQLRLASFSLEKIHNPKLLRSNESHGAVLMKIKRTQIDFLSVVFGNKETRSSLVLTFLRDRMANMPASVQTLRISAPETPQRIKANKSQMY